MEKDFGSWFDHQLSDQHSLNLNAFSARFDLGQQNTVPTYMSPCANVVSPNGTSRGYEFSQLNHSKAGQPNEPHGWFYCLPRFRQAFNPALNSVFKENSPAGPRKSHEELVTPNPVSGCAQKRFLVFDQSGDQTTILFSSGIRTPFQCHASWGQKLDNACDLNKLEQGKERDTVWCPEPILTDNENYGDDIESEMHEDTEELNALLYSDDDDDDYSEDEEETSTGHSPSTMTAYDKQVWLDGSEEIASSAMPTKRMKLLDGGYNVPSLTDTAISDKPKRCSDDYEDDAESSCANGKNEGLGEFETMSGNKRLRKDKIRETVNVLQSIIPEGKGKDAIQVLDEAINYLKSLKQKAETLGIHSL